MRVAIVLTSLDEKNVAKEMITAAEKSGSEDTEFWIFGDSDKYLKEHVKRIIVIQDEGPKIAERFLPVLKLLVTERRPSIVLLSGSCLGDELAIRLGCITEGSCASTITDIGQNESGILIRRRVFGFHVEGEFLYNKAPYIFSVNKGSFVPVEAGGSPKVQKCSFDMPDISCFEDYKEEKEKEEAGLCIYDVVLCGGKGLGSKAAMGRLEKLGKMMGAGVGATRPVVLNTWLPMGKLLGLSGEMIKSKILITFGVSGSAPFIKGVEKSHLLVAINNDENANIFKYCDIGIVGDCNEAIEELLKIVDPIKS